MVSQEGFSVELMDGITVLMDGISQEDYDSKLVEELESVKSSLRDEIAEKIKYWKHTGDDGMRRWWGRV